MKLGLIFFVVFSNWASAEANINSGCPSWGCVSSGSFSFSSSVSSTNETLKWSTEIDHVQDSLQIANLRGCVSDQMAVVCSTHNGYVYLSPGTGQELWNCTSMDYPYLPVMDIFGNFIGMDNKQLVYLNSNGFYLQSINVSVINPTFSVMLANNSMLLLATAYNNTAQIVTYNTDGIVCGAIPLRGSVKNVTGTFRPHGHPIIVGYRAYVITKFAPDVKGSLKASAAAEVYRLYALDLLNHMDLRIKIAWYTNLEPEKLQRSILPHPVKVTHQTDVNSDILYAHVAYLQGTVYVNIPVGASRQGHGQTYLGVLWGITDHGDKASVLFKKAATYGQLALYDTHDALASSQGLDADQTIWIPYKLNIISGHNYRNGILSHYINTTELANIDFVTSKLAITRQPLLKSSKDILVFGGTDRNGTAYLVALETDSTNQARLLWKTKLSGDLKDGVTWQIVGQLANVALAVPDTKVDAIKWQLYVVAMVLESGKDYNKLYTKAVYSFHL